MGTPSLFSFSWDGWGIFLIAASFFLPPVPCSLIIMTGIKRDFDTAAPSWDENPGRVKLAGDVALAIIDTIPLSPTMDVLDFGCGTGLLTIHLQPHVRSITGVDSSAGMTSILDEKIRFMNLRNAKTLTLDLDRGGLLSGRYHLAVSSMTFHHVQDIPHLLAQLHSVLLPGGWLCVADLDPDQGRFHDDNTGVFHFGFERDAQMAAFRHAGFEQVSCRTAATMTKISSDGQARSFTIALVSGRKPQ